MSSKIIQFLFQLFKYFLLFLVQAIGIMILIHKYQGKYGYLHNFCYVVCDLTHEIVICHHIKKYKTHYEDFFVCEGYGNCFCPKEILWGWEDYRS